MLDLNELPDEAVKGTGNFNEDVIFLVIDLSVVFFNKMPYSDRLIHNMKEHLQIKRDA